jgi:hypothetical protein
MTCILQRLGNSFHHYDHQDTQRNLLADAILRSSLYSHFSESLSGLTTIRAYGESKRFQLENEERVDIENRYEKPSMYHVR